MANRLLIYGIIIAIAFIIFVAALGSYLSITKYSGNIGKSITMTANSTQSLLAGFASTFSKSNASISYVILQSPLLNISPNQQFFAKNISFSKAGNDTYINFTVFTPSQIQSYYINNTMSIECSGVPGNFYTFTCSLPEISGPTPYQLLSDPYSYLQKYARSMTFVSKEEYGGSACNMYNVSFSGNVTIQACINSEGFPLYINTPEMEIAATSFSPYANLTAMQIPYPFAVSLPIMCRNGELGIGVIPLYNASTIALLKIYSESSPSNIPIAVKSFYLNETAPAPAQYLTAKLRISNSTPYFAQLCFSQGGCESFSFKCT